MDHVQKLNKRRCLKKFQGYHLPWLISENLLSLRCLSVGRGLFFLLKNPKWMYLVKSTTEMKDVTVLHFSAVLQPNVCQSVAAWRSKQIDLSEVKEWMKKFLSPGLFSSGVSVESGLFATSPTLLSYSLSCSILTLSVFLIHESSSLSVCSICSVWTMAQGFYVILCVHHHNGFETEHSRWDWVVDFQL